MGEWTSLVAWACLIEKVANEHRPKGGEGEGGVGVEVGGGGRPSVHLPPYS